GQSCPRGHLAAEEQLQDALVDAIAKTASFYRRVPFPCAASLSCHLPSVILSVSSPDHPVTAETSSRTIRTASGSWAKRPRKRPSTLSAISASVPGPALPP